MQTEEKKEIEKLENIEGTEALKTPSLKSEITDWIKTIVFAFALAFVITIFVAPTIVRGQSMYPTLDNNNYLIINKTSYWFSEPQHGDIIVFKSHISDDGKKYKDLVKRVIGVPGDRVNIVDGEVYINGELQEESYINGDYTDGYVDLTVPEDSVFVMGDNRPNSLDSRAEQVGLVAEDVIIGKVVVRLFPFNQITGF